jgi:ABC-type nitrate/sulfonate/bicarbonate transport system substrate-binding protein
MRDVQLHIGTFTPSLVIHLARTTGLLRRVGLDVRETPVVSSPAQFRSLEAGKYDLVMTNPDNVLAYRFLSNNPLGRNLPVEILGAVDRGFGLSLCFAPDISGVDDIGSRPVGVDVALSGFAFVAYELLARAGLTPGSYSVEALGSTPRRTSALIAGDCAATVLGASNELRAQSAGCTVFSTVTDIGPYLGTIIAAMATEESSTTDTRARFVDVIRDACAMVLAGDLEAEVIDAATTVLGLSEPEAEAHYASILNPATGLVADGMVDIASISTVIDLRRKHMPTPELDLIMNSLDQVIHARSLSSQ